MTSKKPLSDVINFGPVTLKEFEAMGLYDLSQLEELGWEEVCKRWVQYFPERLNLNAFAGLRASLEGVSWLKLSAEHKEEARALVNELRQQFGQPPASRRPRKKK